MFKAVFNHGMYILQFLQIHPVNTVEKSATYFEKL